MRCHLAVSCTAGFLTKTPHCVTMACYIPAYPNRSHIQSIFALYICILSLFQPYTYLCKHALKSICFQGVGYQPTILSFTTQKPGVAQ